MAQPAANRWIGISQKLRLTQAQTWLDPLAEPRKHEEHKEKPETDSAMLLPSAGNTYGVPLFPVFPGKIPNGLMIPPPVRSYTARYALLTLCLEGCYDRQEETKWSLDFPIWRSHL